MKSLLLGNLEQEVLSIIWSAQKPISVREVLDQCKEKYAYTTVMTVMNRLEKKGILSRCCEGNMFLYTCAENKEQYADKHLDDIYKSLVDTFGDLAISHFIDSVKNDDKNLKLLENYLSHK